MIIATNTPASFPPTKGFQFVHLGDTENEVTAIVLMLEKNWGSSTIERIQATTHWLSTYPQDVPCYLIGAESTIPNEELWRYVHEGRDSAVRSLCQEVLRRSSSIGVRGEITRRYLIDVIGLTPDQVDVVWEAVGGDPRVRVREFLSKNQAELEPLVESIASFQEQPYVFYERPFTFEQDIRIARPKVTLNGGVARLSAAVRIDGRTETLWCDVDASYHEFLLWERADAFLAAVLPLAMRTGKSVVSEAPISEQLLHNINEILVPLIHAYDPRLFNSRVIAESDPVPLFSGAAVGTGMSCGVDSFYTVHLYKDTQYESMRLTHLLVGNYLYGSEGPVYDRAEDAASDLGLPLVRTGTNINEALRLPHLSTHFFKMMFSVLALRKLFRIYYYSSTDDLGQFSLKDAAVGDTAKMELLLLGVFSSADFQILTGGGRSERLEKTGALVSLSTARKFLNVCLYPDRDRNCGRCGKCIRTLLTLDMLGHLDAFEEVFDIDEYSRNRFDCFVHLVSQKNSTMLAKVYEHFAGIEPELIAEAQRAWDAGVRPRLEPMPRSDS